MSVLPWWIEHGHWIGWLIVAAGGLLALRVLRAGDRRKLERELAPHRATLGDVETRIEPDADGRVTLKGRLRGDGARLERPEDGAPVLAYGVIHASLGPNATPPWSERCLIGDHVSGLALELADGTRVALEGSVELALGSSETGRPRHRAKLSAATRRRIGHHPEIGELSKGAALAFRSLRDGDEVAVSGRIERRGQAEGGDYRTSAGAYALVGGADAHDAPVQLTYAGTPTLQGRVVKRDLGAVVGGVAVALALLAALAGATEDDRDPYAAPRVDVSADDGAASVVAPFETPPPASFFGVLSPFHRDDALKALAFRYEQTAPATEHAARAAFAARDIVSCESGLRERLLRGRYEEVLDAAPGCDGPNTAHHEVVAAARLGRLDRVGEVLARAPETLVPMARADLHVMRRDWVAAAEALEAYVAEQREVAQQGDVDTSEAQRRGTCLRRTFLRRAGRENVEPDETSLEDGFCRAAWADLADPSERAALLGHPDWGRAALLGHPDSGRAHWGDARELGILLSVEAGAPYADDPSYPWATDGAFHQPLRSAAPRYSGLHAAARDRLSREGGAPKMLATLRTQAALFELHGGDRDRAVAFADAALRSLPEDGRVTRASAVSVLVMDALRRGDGATARAVLGRLEGEYPRQRLERWVVLLGDRDATALDDDDWIAAPDRPMARAALAGDGVRLARLLSLRSYQLLDEPALLVPLVERERGVLREHLRWSRRGLLPTHRFGPLRQIGRWRAELWLAEGVDDSERAARAQRILDRFRAMALRRDTAVPMLLLRTLY